MAGPGYVTAHALDRFAEHHATVNVGHFLGVHEDGIPVEKEDAYWVLVRRWDERPGNTYRLTRDGRGMFVLYLDPYASDHTPNFVTYIRLAPTAQDRAAEKFGHLFNYDPIPGTTYRGPQGRDVRVLSVKPDGRVVFQDLSADAAPRSLSASAFAERFHRFYSEP